MSDLEDENSKISAGTVVSTAVPITIPSFLGLSSGEMSVIIFFHVIMQIVWFKRFLLLKSRYFRDNLKILFESFTRKLSAL